MLLPTTVEREDLARHLRYVTTPALWPAWPFLPLVRRTGGGEELGVRFDARGLFGLYGHSATVYLTNLFELPLVLDILLDLPREVYDTAEELVRAGWRVD